MKQKKQKLPKRIKDKWIKALRSGDYKQGTGLLLKEIEMDSFYCCLGVLGKVCGNSESQLINHGVLESYLHSGIPHMLLGDGEENDLVKKLTRFNDDGKSFNWIASYIERYL